MPSINLDKLLYGLFTQSSSEHLSMLKNATYLYHHLLLIILPDLYCQNYVLIYIQEEYFVLEKVHIKYLTQHQDLTSRRFHNLHRMRENLYHTTRNYQYVIVNFDQYRQDFYQTLY